MAWDGTDLEGARLLSLACVEAGAEASLAAGSLSLPTPATGLYSTGHRGPPHQAGGPGAGAGLVAGQSDQCLLALP